MKARRRGFTGWLLINQKKKEKGQSSHNFSLLSFAGFNAIFPHEAPARVLATKKDQKYRLIKLSSPSPLYPSQGGMCNSAG